MAPSLTCTAMMQSSASFAAADVHAARVNTCPKQLCLIEMLDCITQVPRGRTMSTFGGNVGNPDQDYLAAAWMGQCRGGAGWEVC